MKPICLRETKYTANPTGFGLPPDRDLREIETLFPEKIGALEGVVYLDSVRAAVLRNTTYYLFDPVTEHNLAEVMRHIDELRVVMTGSNLVAVAQQIRTYLPDANIVQLPGNYFRKNYI